MRSPRCEIALRHFHFVTKHREVDLFIDSLGETVIKVIEGSQEYLTFIYNEVEIRSELPKDKTIQMLIELCGGTVIEYYKFDSMEPQIS